MSKEQSPISSLDRFRMEIGEMSESEALESAERKHKAEKDRQDLLEAVRRGDVSPSVILKGYDETEDLARETKASLQEIARRLRIDPRQICFPAGEDNVTIARTFPEAHTTFIETQHSCVEALDAAGFDVIEGDMNEVKLDAKADVVYVRYMPHPLSEETLNNLLAQDGVIITDNIWGQVGKYEENGLKLLTIQENPENEDETLYALTR